MFCSNCGKEILEDTYFCSKCGVRTKSGVEAEIPIPKERKYDWKQDLEKAFSKAGREIDKTLSNVGKELEKVFKTTKDTKRELVSCPQCGEKNPSDAKFCYKCGKAFS